MFFGDWVSIVVVNGFLVVVVLGEVGVLEELIVVCFIKELWICWIEVDYVLYLVEVEVICGLFVEVLFGIEL